MISGGGYRNDVIVTSRDTNETRKQEKKRRQRIHASVKKVSLIDHF